MRLNVISVFALALLVPAAVCVAQDKAKPAKDSAAAKKVVCTAGKVERTVEIKDREGGGCAVTYTRDGQAKEVGSAAHDTAVCARVQEKLVKNLEAAGFQCK